MGARVGITGRDLARAEAAAAEIRAASGNPAVDAFAADLSSQAEVRRLAAEVLAAYPRLDVLVNNVGGFWATATSPPTAWSTRSRSTTSPVPAHQPAAGPAQGQRPGAGRHGLLGAQSMGRIDFDDLQGERNYSGQRAYNQSKLANVMFTYELARRLDGTGVTATVLHPGRGAHRLRRRGPSLDLQAGDPRWCGRS